MALTLDNGPDPEYTPVVLKLAKEKGIKLTFFLSARRFSSTRNSPGRRWPRVTSSATTPGIIPT